MKQVTFNGASNVAIRCFFLENIELLCGYQIVIHIVQAGQVSSTFRIRFSAIDTEQLQVNVVARVRDAFVIFCPLQLYIQTSSPLAFALTSRWLKASIIPHLLYKEFAYRDSEPYKKVS